MAQLKIVSWNILGRHDVPGVIGRLKSMGGDIIGLQEVLQDEDGNNNDAQTIADALGCEFIYEPTILLDPAVSHLLKQLGASEPAWWGNAVLSKYPIKNKRVHSLSEIRRRTAVEATVEIDGKELHAFSTHLVHGDGEAAQIHLAQVETLLKIVPHSAAIVMGDFNATPESEAVQKMSSVLIQTEGDLSRVTRGMHPEVYSAPDLDSEKKRIDYIFATRDIKIVSSGVIDSNASDHLPIYATVEFP